VRSGRVCRRARPPRRAPTGCHPAQPHSHISPSSNLLDPMNARQLARQHTRTHTCTHASVTAMRTLRAAQSGVRHTLFLSSPRQTAAGWRWLGLGWQTCGGHIVVLRIGPHIRQSSMLAKSGSNAVPGGRRWLRWIYGCGPSSCVRIPFISSRPQSPHVHTTHRLTLSISSDVPRPPDHDATTPPATASDQISDAAALWFECCRSKLQTAFCTRDATDSTTVLTSNLDLAERGMF